MSLYMREVYVYAIMHIEDRQIDGQNEKDRKKVDQCM